MCCSKSEQQGNNDVSFFFLCEGKENISYKNPNRTGVGGNTIQCYVVDVVVIVPC